MKCFILILFLSINTFSHESHKMVGELSYSETRELIEKLQKERPDLYKRINDRVILEFAKKENDTFTQEIMSKSISHDLEGTEDFWLLLAYAYSGMRWSLKDLDVAFEKKACVASALYRVQYFSRFLDEHTKEKKYYTESELKIIENLNHLFSHHYASSYMTSKLYVHEFEKYKNDEHIVIKRVTNKISKLSKKEQKEVWDLVKNWEKKWGDKLYNPKSNKECDISDKKYYMEIKKEVIIRLLKKIHESNKAIHELSYLETKGLIEKLQKEHPDLYKHINDRVFFEFAKKGGNIFAREVMSKSVPHYGNDDLNGTEDVWLFLADVYSGMHWALKALDTAFEKKVCVVWALKRIQDLSEFFDSYKSTHYYTKNEIKIIENLNHLSSYHYASSYMNAKIYVHKFEKYKTDDNEIIKRAKEKISKLSKKEQKEVWDLVKNWEKKWEDKLYNPKDTKECEISQKKDHMEIKKETVTRLLKKIHGQ